MVCFNCKSISLQLEQVQTARSTLLEKSNKKLQLIVSRKCCAKVQIISKKISGNGPLLVYGRWGFGPATRTSQDSRAVLYDR